MRPRWPLIVDVAAVKHNLLEINTTPHTIARVSWRRRGKFLRKSSFCLTFKICEKSVHGSEAHTFRGFSSLAFMASRTLVDFFRKSKPFSMV